MLLIPSIQGTTPGFILAFISALLVFLIRGNVRSQIVIDWVKISYFFILITLVSQVGIVFFGIPDLLGLSLTDPFDWATKAFRLSIFTQTLYLVPGLILFTLAKYFYNEKWDKYTRIGILIFCLYGLYEFVYYLIFKTNGDFISNRNFGEHNTVLLGMQPMTIGSFTFLRVNSLALEPSMFAFTVIPFWIYFQGTKHKFATFLIGLALFLSASTTFFVVLALYGIYKIFNNKNKFLLLMAILLGVLGALIFWDQLYGFIEKTILSKIYLSNESGTQRFGNFESTLSYFSHLNFLNLFFGIGFGVIRSTDFFSTILLNMGIVGLLTFTFIFMYPIFKLKNNERNNRIKFALFAIFITMMISVPEFSFLSIWFFLGIAYNQIIRDKKEPLL